MERQGLGRYADPTVIEAARREIAEAYNLDPEQMDHAAANIIQKSPKYYHHMGERFCRFAITLLWNVTTKLNFLKIF